MKKALLVGLNYDKPSFPAKLRGCINDVQSLKNILLDLYGFASTDIKLLTEADGSRQNIMQELTKLVDSASPGDTLVFGFSGHGTEKEDPVDRTKKQQAIVPYEATYNSLVTDQELYSIIGKRGEAFLNSIDFTAIYDCCHSGTMIREFIFNTMGEMEEQLTNRCVFIPLLEDFPLKEINLGPYNVFSACQDNETAADLKVEGVDRGAFSYALHKIIRENPEIRIADIEAKALAIINKISTHKQVPNYYANIPTNKIFHRA